MADVALLAGGVQEAPLDYVIPGAQEIVPKSSTAAYDGSGAAGAYVPTLQIIAPNGAVLASCPVSTPLAAGASADVSWFPRGGLSTGGAPLDTTNGLLHVDPTTELLIDGGLTLTEPSPGVARVSATAVVVAADARHYGWIGWQVFRPTVPNDTIVYGDIPETIVGTKANGATIGNLYDRTVTWQVHANDYLSVFFVNASGATRNVQTSFCRVQDAGGNIEVMAAASAPQNVANGVGFAFDFAHSSGAALLNYATPTRPKFIAGGTYNVELNVYISFWV